MLSSQINNCMRMNCLARNRIFEQHLTTYKRGCERKHNLAGAALSISTTVKQGTRCRLSV